MITIESSARYEGSNYYSDLAEGFPTKLGGVYRLSIGPGGDRTRIRAGEQVRWRPCSDEYLPLRRPRAFRRSAARVVESPRGASWRTRVVRGPFGLRCVESRRGGSRERECERIALPTSAVVGMHRTGTASLLVAQAPTLRSITVTSPAGVRTVAAPRGSRLAAIAYHGDVPAATLRVTLRFAGGRQRTVTPYGFEPPRTATARRNR